MKIWFFIRWEKPEFSPQLLTRAILTWCLSRISPLWLQPPRQYVSLTYEQWNQDTMYILAFHWRPLQAHPFWHLCCSACLLAGCWGVLYSESCTNKLFAPDNSVSCTNNTGLMQPERAILPALDPNIGIDSILIPYWLCFCVYVFAGSLFQPEGGVLRVPDPTKPLQLQGEALHLT